MNIELDEVAMEKLRAMHIMIATPMYGGMCGGSYMRSVLEFQAFAMNLGIKTTHYFIMNESLITRARNYCTDVFLESDCTHLLFIDADVSFSRESIIHLLAFVDGHPSTDNIPLDIFAASYPKKGLDWNAVKKAALNNKDLESASVTFACNFAMNKNSFHTSELEMPVEVLESGTGFMLIRRQTFERWKEAYPQSKYTPDQVETTNWSGDREIYAFFDCVIDDKRNHLREEIESWTKATESGDEDRNICEYLEDSSQSHIPDRTYSKRYLSEDYYFCQMTRRAGMKVWVAPWLELTHSGNYNFKGSLAQNLIAKAK